MKGWGEHTLAQGVLVGLFLLALAGVVAVVVRVGRPPGVEVVLPTPTPLPALHVHVSGAVARPGRYILPLGARVADALDAAGGALPGADLDRLNLARPLTDGERVIVPLVGTPLTASPGEGPAAAPEGEPLDLNTASVQALQALPGIGPILAQRIVDYRTRFGPFTRVEDLLKVEGIGPRTLERLRPFVTVR
jgi:competence protein ComEA